MKTYLISEIAEDLKENKAMIRRTIKRLGLQEVNKSRREHANSPKKYSLADKKLIEAHLTPDSKRTVAQHEAIQEYQERYSSDTTRKKASEQDLNQESDTEAHLNNDGAIQERYTNLLERYNTQEDMISLLKQQLEQAHNDKTDLIRLLDQQQHLNLTAQDKLETLQIELKETEADKKGLFSNLFRSKKDRD